MYAIYAYIGVVLGINVGIYGIHGVSGYITPNNNECVFPRFASGSLLDGWASCGTVSVKTHLPA